MATMSLRIYMQTRPWMKFVLRHWALRWTIGVAVLKLPIPARWYIRAGTEVGI